MGGKPRPRRVPEHLLSELLAAHRLAVTTGDHWVFLRAEWRILKTVDAIVASLKRQGEA